MSASSIRELLLREFEKRRVKNARYSQRAFARFLAISPSTLSLILAGRRSLSRRHAGRIAKRLELSADDRDILLRNSVVPSKGNVWKSEVHGFEVIDQTTFKLISEWYYYAILSLAELTTNVADHNWIADRLGIGSEEAKTAFDKLQALGFIKRVGDQFRCTKHLTTEDDITSADVNHYHRQILALADGSLEHCPADERDFSTISIATSLKYLPRARELIQAFRRDLMTQLEAGERDQIFMLSIQLFPIGRTKDEARTLKLARLGS